MDPAKVADQLRRRALGYPETYEESPWGDRVVKVKGKIFLFCGAHDGQLMLSVKLPSSGRAALREPWARPTPYGLGKSGWVSATFAKGAKIPLERIAAFIDESYRALAPKKLVALLDAPATQKSATPKTQTTRKSAAAKTTTTTTTRTKKLPHRVLLLSQDRLRTERAAGALAPHGVKLEGASSAAAVRARLAKLDALIVDVGRAADAGLALAAEIDASDHPIHLFIAGIRDARAWRSAEKAASSAERFRSPPGDPDTIAAIVATLGKHPARRNR